MQCNTLGWGPPPVSKDIKKRMDKMKEELNNIAANNTYQFSTNLTREEHKLLAMLQKNDDFIIATSDKNLGPCILEREVYIQRCLKEHLSNTTTYQQLDDDEASFRFNAIRIRLSQIIKDAALRKQLAKNENFFLKRGS